MHEVLNGLFERPDWREAMDSLPLGIVPAGSGNALARSIIHQQNELFNASSQAISCSVNISKNGTTPLDLMYVETPYMTRVCVVSITWGLIADIDIGSEAYRKLGEKRFTITAIDKIAKRQVYRARISYLPLSRDTVDSGSDKDSAAATLTGVDNEVFSDEEVGTEHIIQELRKAHSHDRLDDEASSNSEGGSSELPQNDDDDDDNEDTSASEILGEDSDDGDYDPRHGKPNSRRQQPTVEVLESGPGVAPGQQPPGAYLVPKNVSYGTMLAQGQLYFRSWQELQSRVLMPAGALDGGYGMMMLPSEIPDPAMAASQAVSPPPSTLGGGPGGNLPPPCPKHGYQQIPSYLQQQATANSSTYSTAAAALKRAEDHTRPYFKDLPTLTEEDLSTSSGGGSGGKWVTETSDYLGVSLVNVPYLSCDTKIAPNSNLSDGCLYLVIMRGTMSRTTLVKLMDKAKSGLHVQLPGVEVIPVQAARIEPLPRDDRGDDKLGTMCLDGELVKTTAVQAHVMPKTAKIFTK